MEIFTANQDNKILKNNQGEKSLKAPFMNYADLECCLKKCIYVKIIQKNLTHRKKLSIRLLVTYCLRIVQLVKQKQTLLLQRRRICGKVL